MANLIFLVAVWKICPAGPVSQAVIPSVPTEDVFNPFSLAQSGGQCLRGVQANMFFEPLRLKASDESLQCQFFLCRRAEGAVALPCMELDVCRIGPQTFISSSVAIEQFVPCIIGISVMSKPLLKGSLQRLPA